MENRRAISISVSQVILIDYDTIVNPEAEKQSPRVLDTTLKTGRGLPVSQLFYVLSADLLLDSYFR